MADSRGSSSSARGLDSREPDWTSTVRCLRQDLFAEFCEEFTREMNRLRGEHRASPVAAERELVRLEARRKKLVESIMQGVYDVSPDGQRFLMNTLVEEATVSPITRPWLRRDGPSYNRSLFVDVAVASRTRARRQEWVVPGGRVQC